MSNWWLLYLWLKLLFLKPSQRNERDPTWGPFIDQGLVLDVYFRTKSRIILYKGHRTEFSTFVDELIVKVAALTAGTCSHKASWIVCSTETNAHFSSSRSPLKRRMIGQQ